VSAAKMRCGTSVRVGDLHIGVLGMPSVPIISILLHAESMHGAAFMNWLPKATSCEGRGRSDHRRRLRSAPECRRQVPLCTTSITHF
jgi:hypothetical protein